MAKRRVVLTGARATSPSGCSSAGPSGGRGVPIDIKTRRETARRCALVVSDLTQPDRNGLSPALQGRRRRHSLRLRPRARP